MTHNRKRYSIDRKHEAFVQATQEAYRCGSEADAINLLLDFIQDGTLANALGRIRKYQQSAEMAHKLSEALPSNQIRQQPWPSPSLQPQALNGHSSPDVSELEALAAVLPEEF